MSFDPTLLPGTSGNVLANTLLNHYPTSPSSVNFNVNFSNVIGGYLQIWNVGGGSVNATNGVQITSYASPDGGASFDTVPYQINLVFTTIASTIQRLSYYLDNGYYNINLVNLDPLNNINVLATTGIQI